LDIEGIYDITLISNPIHVPSHELEDTDNSTPPTRVISKRILVELLGIREENVILYLWSMNPLAYFSLLFYVETCQIYVVFVQYLAKSERFSTPINVVRDSKKIRLLRVDFLAKGRRGMAMILVASTIAWQTSLKGLTCKHGT
jgi:hypothetical protein